MSTKGRPRSRDTGVDLADFLGIEKGNLINPEEGQDRTWIPLDDVSLRIKDTDGSVSVIGKLYIEEPGYSGPALLTVVSLHSGGPEESLEVAVSLFDFRSEEYTEIGKKAVTGGSDQKSRFRTRFGPQDCRIGDQGEIRLRLAVSTPKCPWPSNGYVFSIKAVSLRFGDAKTDEPLSAL